MGAHIQEYRPSDDLRPYVQRFWTGCFDGSHAHGLALRVVPNGFLEFMRFGRAREGNKTHGLLLA